MDNSFWVVVTSFQMGAMLEVHLTGAEWGQVGLCCHFALDCLCDNWDILCARATAQSATADASTSPMPPRCPPLRR